MVLKKGVTEKLITFGLIFSGYLLLQEPLLTRDRYSDYYAIDPSFGTMEDMEDYKLLRKVGIYHGLGVVTIAPVITSGSKYF